MKTSNAIKITITLLCFFTGWHLFFEGYVKVFDPYWTSTSYLKSATGPLAFAFKMMAESDLVIIVIDFINIYGQIAIGLLLIVGIYRRLAAIGGALLLFLYYISTPPLSATGIGFAMEGHYLIINKTLIESLLLVLLALFPKEWSYGLHQLDFSALLSVFKRKAKAGSISKNYPMDRRDVIKNLMWVPFLGGGFSLAVKSKKAGIDGISGATSTLDAGYEHANKPISTYEHLPNEPMGKPVGIFPGRVGWVWNPAATNPNCRNVTNNNGILDEGDDAWFLDKNTSQVEVDNMFIAGLQTISGETESKRIWDALFKFHNIKRGKGNQPYQKGEKVFIKTNRTSAAYGWNDGFKRLDSSETLCCETSPQIVLSILRQLVNIAGVAQEDISVGDPMSVVFDDEYQKYYAEFPKVKYLSNDSNDYGRTQVDESSKELIFYSDKKLVMKEAGSDKFYSVLEDAEYLISISAMKGHHAAGISLCTKNHFGTQSRKKALHLHAGLNSVRNTIRYGMYRVLVDIMGNKHSGDKNLFYILDALWSGGDWNGLPVKFLMPPFNNHWCSSLLLSLDPVAIESVAFDFLRTEFSNVEHSYAHVNYPGVDDYLHQAADSKNWPDGIIYSPNGDGMPMADSLGVHEHWNNPNDKQYSANLGSAKGIELVSVFQNKDKKFAG